MNTKLWERAISVRIVILPVFYYNGEAYFVTKNAQQDVIAIRNASGAIVVQYYYDAWGNPTAVIGDMASSLESLNPIRYRGYVYDEETGNYFLNARYYDPEIGRFISADSTEVPTVTPGNTKWDKNLYAYCDNNPVSRVDDQGQCWIPGAVIGGILGGSFAILNDLVMGDGISPESVLLGVVSGAVNGAIGLKGMQLGLKATICAVSSGVTSYLSGDSATESLIVAATAAVTAIVSEPACGLVNGMSNKVTNNIYKAIVGGNVTAIFETNATIVKRVTVGNNNTAYRPNRPKATTYSSYIPTSSGTYSGHSGGGKYTNKQMNF